MRRPNCLNYLMVMLLAGSLGIAGCSDGEEGGRDSGAQQDTSAQVDTAGQTDLAGADAGDDAAVAPSCADYCTAVQAACTGDNEQYADGAACLAYCDAAGLVAGESGATSGNTVGCRATHAALAASSGPAVHCPHAGPSGGNVCGTWCQVYCDLVGVVCIGDNAITFDPDCATECADYGDEGSPGDTSGDTVQCRITHAGLGTSAPAVHCPHADPTGGDVCVDGG